jgi:hypothetical protein
MIVQFGQPLTLKRQSGVDLQTIMRDVVAVLNNSPRTSGALTGPVIIDSQASLLLGEFDSAILTDALKSISVGAMKMITKQSRKEPLLIHLTDEANKAPRHCVIDWQVFDSSDHDPFHSFAGSDEIRMSLAAKAIEAHGGSAERHNGSLRVRLPLGP